jgi:hypothetical protein
MTGYLHTSDCWRNLVPSDIPIVYSEPGGAVPVAEAAPPATWMLPVALTIFAMAHMDCHSCPILV